VTERPAKDRTVDRAPRAWLAWATPLLVGAWILQPRLATNRPSYGSRELLILATVLLAVPGVYATARLARGGRRPRSRPATVRMWLWSATAAFASLPVVLTVAGILAPLPSSYPDDQIPGLEAGLLSATVAVVLAVTTLGWKALEAAVARRNRAAVVSPR